MDRQQLRDKFRGALLGVAIGDSLGAPFEGMPYISVSSLLALAEEAPGPLRYTDDTHMTLGVADSLVAKQGFDGPHMAETFARNYEEEPWRGYGAGPPQIFQLLRRGIPWNETSLAGRAPTVTAQPCGSPRSRWPTTKICLRCWKSPGSRL